MEFHRLFIGLPLPEAYQLALEALTTVLRPHVRSKCAWTKPCDWHLTLKFLGDTPIVAIPAIQAALSAVAWEPFAFTAGGGGFFPSALRPRVLWVGAGQGGRETCALAASIESALAGLGMAPDARPFTVHLTLARIKGSARRERRPGDAGHAERAQQRGNSYAASAGYAAHDEADYWIPIGRMGHAEHPEQDGRAASTGHAYYAGHALRAAHGDHGDPHGGEAGGPGRAGQTGHAASGDDWKAVLREIERFPWPEIGMDRFVLWRSMPGAGGGGGGAGKGPGQPGPRYVPVGTYAAAG